MEKDSLLEELAEAIAQGPIIFTPDDSWEEKLEEKKMKLKNTPFTIQHVKNWHPVRWVRTQIK